MHGPPVIQDQLVPNRNWPNNITGVAVDRFSKMMHEVYGVRLPPNPGFSVTDGAFDLGRLGNHRAHSTRGSVRC